VAIVLLAGLASATAGAATFAAGMRRKAARP
jgi:hypothetical protein